MHELQLKDARELSLILDDISRRFSFWRIVRTLIATRFRLMRERWALEHLDNATRRDIGLPEKERQPHLLLLFPWGGRL